MTATRPRSSSWAVYIVCCNDGSFYVGISDDVSARVAAHNAGRGARYTRARRPVFVVWQCDTETAEEARRLEGLLKHRDRRVRASIIDGDVVAVAELFAIVWSRMATVRRKGPAEASAR